MIARVLGACAVLLGVACSNQAPPPGPLAHPTAQPGLDPAAAQDVCARFTVAALSSDTSVDRGPADARRRAAQQYGQPQLIDQFDGEGRDHSWPQLAEHRARIQVTTQPIADDPPRPHPTTAAAAVLARRTAIGPDGWRHDLPSTIAYCALTQHADTWAVSAITFAATSTGATP